MAAPRPSILLDELPPEMVGAVVGLATRDAACVDVFLGRIAEQATFKKPITPNFLLHLGAALRLHIWEANNLFFHREAGLPEARRAIQDALLSLNNPEADSAGFCASVMHLYLKRFAWSGYTELGADIALGESQEDLLLDVLAEFLWAHRPR